MVVNNARKMLSVVVSLILITTSTNVVYGYQTSVSPLAGDNGGATAVAPMSPDQLDALVAPIALYPDPLVAQILGAATFPIRWRSRTTGSRRMKS